MATLKERPDNWAATSIIHRDHRHTHDGGYEDTPHRKKKGKAKKKRVRSGCPGNDNGPHVYVWDTAGAFWFQYGTRMWYLESDYNIVYEKKFCCGCGKRGKGFRRRKVD